MIKNLNDLKLVRNNTKKISPLLWKDIISKKLRATGKIIGTIINHLEPK